MDVNSLTSKKTLFLSIIFSVLSVKTLFAAEKSPDDISWIFLIMGLFGGLAFFLYGLEKMSEGMKKTAGNLMRSILAAFTRNRLVALFIGAFVTMVIQSSSATTVMLVSFVQAKLLSFVQSLGIILGADIGTTVTAQLIAFKLTHYSLIMVIIGFGMRMLGNKSNIRDTGDIILGFGILFFGMKMMSDAMKPIRELGEIVGLSRGLENPFYGLIIGIVFTAVIQSSAAFVGIVIVLAQQGLVSLEAGIPLIFGGNIGTCVTAVLACIGASREAKRVALAHVLFKVAGVMLFIFWIPDFARLIQAIAGEFDSGVARQIANAHTIFNVSLALIFLPFTDYFSKFIVKILPDKIEDIKIIPTSWHLDEISMETPALAIDLVRREISGMAELLERMLRAIIVPFISDEKWITGK
ncbi:Na/Pi cotransporter family protein, partial [Thermodesulfobacteriota bacterium]